MFPDTMNGMNDRQLRLCRALITFNVVLTILTFVAVTLVSARTDLSGSRFESPRPHGISDWPGHHVQDPSA